MRHDIVLAPEAREDLRRPETIQRAEVRAAMEKHLRHEPTKVSKSRIKRLRDVRHPSYRLRVGEIRVFYDVSGGVVQVLAIVPKSQVSKWLSQWGVAE